MILVAVVSWNTRALLARCLDSLRGDDLQVVVVDNGSTDGSQQEVRSRPWATLIEPGQNLGFGRAVNLAVASGPRTEWIAVANADVAVEPGALDALLAAGEADPGAGIIAPRLILPDGRTQPSVQSFPTLAVTLLFNLGLHRLSPRLADRLCLSSAWDPGRARRVPWAVAAFLLIRRSAWDAGGGFDESMWMYAEDVDLGWRLHRAGWATRYAPDARVLHESGAAARQAFDDAADRWQQETYAWIRRRRGWALTTAVAAINLAGAAARWLVRPRERDAWRAWTRRHAGGLKSRGARDDAR